MGWTALYIYMVVVIIKSLLLPPSVDKYLSEVLDFVWCCGCFLKCFFVLKCIKIIFFYFLKIIFEINILK
jgi:hypothetical protein